MRILAIEPYWGGSHKAFVESWRKRSRHDWTLLTLPPYKWKWRMRHSALTCARLASDRYRAGERWDLILASDMLDLAQFCGLVPPEVAALPRISYFHENQLLYPSRHHQERDLHYAYTNFTSCLAADAVWFNTAWHRQSFLEALGVFLRRMPDYGHQEEVETIRAASAIMPQGIEPPPERPARKPGPLRIIWAARWEHDKNPGDLYGALKLLREEGVDFGVSVIGEVFQDAPAAFSLIEDQFRDRLLRWGYQPSREDYYDALNEADVFVSTAEQEFFGVSLMEAASCGTVPLAPERLAYPEVLQGHGDFLYNGTARHLTRRLAECVRQLETPEWRVLQSLARQLGGRFLWPELTEKYDNLAQEILERPSSRC